ncbi:Inner nuclear membrane protein Man1 [Lamellibrachia satsuma]|nr:Inner nuclear membrane protein Man1 [Lamellibrachia satsuma]
MFSSYYYWLMLLLEKRMFFTLLGLRLHHLLLTTVPVTLKFRTFPPSANRKQLICSKSDHSGKADSDCGQAEAPLVLVKSIIDMLAIRAGNYDCGAEVYGRNMSLLEVEEELRKMHGPKMLDNLEKAIELIQMNTQWRIGLLNATGHTSEKSENTVVAMESEQSNMSLLCRLRRSARFVGYIVVVAVIAALFVTVVIAALRYKWRERERRAQEVYKIVEQIIEILQRHCEDNEGKDGMKPYLAIPHVRDMLIAPADRAQKQALWDKAVKFLSANESRIRVETQKIHGEEFAVWRWLQPVPNGSRVWQGQAFGEYRDTSLNAPPCSSTPCLKIRNMFDPDIEYGDDWHIYVQDAILEKCSTNHSILHIAVDRNSKEGCVYVKFATPESAGRAFKALHGWWFDGNLVTVKYLRLERYHERFPDSIGITAYMQPSNSQKKSLSVPFYRSVLETS